MEEIVKFLKEAETYYLATVEGDQPRVRPFGTAHIFEGKLYIQTGKKKDVSKQLHANPKVELCAFKGGEWIRVAGELVEDDRLVRFVPFCPQRRIRCCGAGCLSEFEENVCCR